jgi:menaquinone-dependent protoporphyrinogen oxidase
MKTLIVYATRHGCTGNAAFSLKDKLVGTVQVADIKIDDVPDLQEFDTVIVGGSIHAGQIQKEIKRFLSYWRAQLTQKRLGLFLCCMYEGEQAKTQFEQAYSKELRDHATTTGLFGGEFDFEKMSAFEQAIIKKVANVEKSITKINKSAIDEFAKNISN